MSVIQTVLVFVVAPAAIVAVIAGLSLAGGHRGNKRYRPGRPFEFSPVWFLSSPEQLPPDASEASAPALPAARERAQLTAGSPVSAFGGAVDPARRQTGGASDRW